MKINAEDAVQAALVVEKWCKKTRGGCHKECPFYIADVDCSGWARCVIGGFSPYDWNLAEFLRARGMKK